MIGLFASALPVVLQIVGWFLGKSAASDDMKRLYLQMVARFESETGNPVRMSDAHRILVEALKKEIADAAKSQDSPSR